MPLPLVFIYSLPMYKAVIFDRDATLNHTTQILRPGQNPGDATDGYVLSPAELRLFDSVQPALTLLRTNGIALFVFTQQNCIAKGLISEDAVHDIHTHMNMLLGEDARIDGFKLAWKDDHPTQPRGKPNPAMIFEIMQENNLRAEDILVAGDSLRDYEAACAAGCDFAWIRDDLKRVSEKTMQDTGCPIFDDALQLAQHILQRQ